MEYLIPSGLSLNKKNKNNPTTNENNSITVEDDFEKIINDIIIQKQKNNKLMGIELNSLLNHIQNIKILKKNSQN